MTCSLAAFTRGFAAQPQRISVLAFLAPSWELPSCSQISPRRRHRIRSFSSRSGELRQRPADLPTSAASDDALSTSGHVSSAQHASVRHSFDTQNGQDLPFPLTLFQNLKGESSRGVFATLSRENADLKHLLAVAKALFQLNGLAGKARAPTDIIALHSPWYHKLDHSKSLEECTRNVYSFNVLPSTSDSMSTMQEISENWNGDERERASRIYHEAIGDLWYAIGETAIRASTLSEEGKARVMQGAYLLLAQMHSCGLVPSDIYGFEGSEIPQSRRKPPYLHILGARMMAAMSDATWKAGDPQWSAGKNHLSPDLLDLADGRGGPRIRKLHPNSWLEFVLWACLKYGYFIEAAKLLSACCLTQGHNGWTTLSWDQVLDLQNDHHRRDQSWFDRVMTLVEGYNEERPLIEMPPKTISREVVVSILHGLLAAPDGLKGVRSARRIAFYVYCQSALSDPASNQALTLNAQIQRFSEAAELDASIIGSLFSSSGKLKDLAFYQLANYQVAPSDSVGDSDQPVFPTAIAQDQPIPMINQLVCSFDSQVFDGEIVEALATFDQIRRLRRDLLEPLELSKRDEKDTIYPPLGRSMEADIHDRHNSSMTLGKSNLSIELPDSTLTTFLKLAVSTKNFENARLLLYDEGFVLPSRVNDPIWQPALFQAAVALSDKPLLQKLAAALRGHYDAMSDDALHAIFETQISMRDIFGAREVLEVIRTDRQQMLPLRFISLVACEYMTLFDAPGVRDSLVLKRLRGLLCDLLTCRYLPPHAPSKPLDYTPERQIAQLARILRTVLPPGDQIVSLEEFSRKQHVQLQVPIEISAEAFNPFLETLVKMDRSTAAQELFEQWCSRAQPRAPSLAAKSVEGIPTMEPPFEGGEKVVVPTMESVHIILRPALEDLRAFHADPYTSSLQSISPTRRLLRWAEATPNGAAPNDTEEFCTHLSPLTPRREVLEWCAKTLQWMGLDEFAINEIIPGTFPNA